MERAISDTAATAIITVASDGRIEACNPAAARLFGYDPGSLIGQDLRLVVDASLPQADARSVQDLLRGTETLVSRRELTGLHKDGGRFPIELLVSRVQRGESDTLVISIRDISDEKHLEAQWRASEKISEELRLAKEQAEIDSQAKSEFLATLSREIRTPINVILASLGSVLKTALTDEQRGFIETASESGKALLAAADSIADFSTIETLRPQAKQGAFDVVQLVESVAESVAAQAHNEPIEIAAFVSPAVPRWLRADADLLRQALLRLAAKAVALTVEGGVAISVTLNADENAEPAALLRFEVQDTARIIPEATQSQGAEHSLSSSSAALDTEICQRLVAMLGGELDCSSVVGQGNRAWFTIKCARISAPTAQPSFPALQGLQVLVVEANPLSRQIHIQQLQAWGVDVNGVGSGSAALAALQSAQQRGAPFSAVLIDQELPDSSGEELGATILRLPALASSRLILMSRLPASALSAGIRKLGFRALLTKPIRQFSLYHWLCIASGLIRDESLMSAEQEGAVSHSIAPSRRGRILLAEDSQVSQIVTVAMLEKAGYQVDTVSNGVEALQALQTQTYNAVLMDMAMPEMDGCEATARIRQLAGPRSSVPIIALTAEDIPEARQRCLAVGMNDCLTKPVDQVRLLAVLERWLPTVLNPPAQPSTALDWQTLQQLEADTDPAVLDRAIKLFIDEANSRLQQIAQARTDKDWTRLKKEAHALKSSAGTFGVKRLHQHALRLEEACQLGDWDTGLALAETIATIAASDLEVLAHYGSAQR